MPFDLYDDDPPPPPAKKVGPIKMALLGVSNRAVGQGQRRVIEFWLKYWQPETVIMLPFSGADQSLYDLAAGMGFFPEIFDVSPVEDEHQLATNVADLIFAADVVLVISPSHERVHEQTITMRCLKKFDKPWIVCLPGEQQWCVSNPYEWVLPRTGPSIQAQLDAWVRDNQITLRNFGI